MSQKGLYLPKWILCRIYNSALLDNKEDNNSDIEILTEVKNDEIKNENCETVMNSNSLRLDKLTNDLNRRLNESLSKNGDSGGDTTDISDTNSDSDALEVIEEIPIVVQSVTGSCWCSAFKRGVAYL